MTHEKEKISKWSEKMGDLTEQELLAMLQEPTHKKVQRDQIAADALVRYVGLALAPLVNQMLTDLAASHGATASASMTSPTATPPPPPGHGPKHEDDRMTPSPTGSTTTPAPAPRVSAIGRCKTCRKFPE